MRRVLVIGAGAAGLTAIKACKEDGLDVLCYERSGRVAGLWNFHEDDVDGEASVMKTTVINSSKEMSAFSDFPPPKEFPNYMHNRMMLKYFTMYAETFGLLEHIKYFREVQKLVPSPDYDETGKWIVTTKNLKDQTVLKEQFDAVMICTGHHGYPHVPRFRGQEDFKGRVMHSHSLKQPDAYKDQNVLIIGAGNSGLDAAVDISNVATQVYLSSRRGAWIMFRLGAKGLPNDAQMLTRLWNLTGKFLGPQALNAYMEYRMNGKFDHATYNLKPKHRFNAQHLAINDHIPNKILSGTVILKGDVKTFTENGVIFEGDESETKIDSVVLATGYKIKFPFLSNKILDTSENQADLYKFVFPPHLKHPTLGVVGLIQPFGSLFPIFEAQARWFAQILNRKATLPSCSEMMEDIQKTRRDMLKRYVGTQRHTVQVDFVSFMDEIYSKIGAKPNLWKLAITDPRLCYQCLAGPCAPYQYRLQGPHSWSGARKAIMEMQDRIMAPLNTRQGEKNKFIETLLFIQILIAIFVFLLSVLIWRSLN